MWEATQHLVWRWSVRSPRQRTFSHRLGGYGDRARQLAYVLFQKATDKGWAEEASACNSLILASPASVDGFCCETTTSRGRFCDDG